MPFSQWESRPIASQNRSNAFPLYSSGVIPVHMKKEQLQVQLWSSWCQLAPEAQISVKPATSHVLNPVTARHQMSATTHSICRMMSSMVYSSDEEEDQCEKESLVLLWSNNNVPPVSSTLIIIIIIIIHNLFNNTLYNRHLSESHH